MRNLLQDLRYGFRMLMKSPGFTLVAVLSLALGIGANIAIFSLMDAALLRPLPASNPQELVSVFTQRAEGLNSAFSYPLYQDYRDRNDAFSGFIAFSQLAVSISSENATERVAGEIVSGNYFDVLGVHPAKGRAFLPDEDRTPGAHPVAVIGYELWQRRFNSDPNILNKIVKLNAYDFQIVGVAPREFKSAIRGYNTDVWVPLMMSEQVQRGSSILTSRGQNWLNLMGRLKPGMSREAAQSSILALTNKIVAEHPEGTEAQVLLQSGEHGFTALLSDLSLPLKILMTVVGIVLLIACANVANLLLARATARRKEIAVRLALGASRWRLIRQLLTESLLLSLLGGALGLLFALWTLDSLSAFKSPVSFVDITLDTGLDARTFLFALGVSALTGLVFGLFPALSASRSDLVPALKDEAVTFSFGQRRTIWRNLLVVAQIALSLVVLVAMGLFLRSLQKLNSIDPGFKTENVLMMSFDPKLSGYDEARGRAFYKELLERAQQQPGVAAASLARVVRLSFGGSRQTIGVEGYQPGKDEDMELDYNIVSPQYLQTMSIPILRGRDFTERDDKSAPLVVIVNETLARRYFPGGDALGRRIVFPGYKDVPNRYAEVVGIAKEGKYRNLREAERPSFYVPFQQDYRATMTLHVRTTGDPQTVLAALRREVQALDKDLPIFNVKTYREQFSSALYKERLATTLLSVFGVLALLLSAIGIYGVIAYSISQRTREIGIRMALGAQARDILKMVLGQGMLLTAIGIAIGLAAAFALTRITASLLYEVSATDPLSFIGVTLALALVALLASYIPARRATKVDPMTALRYE